MIYTGRYANKEINNNEYFVVRISLGFPKYELSYKIDYDFKLLKPSWSSMNDEESIFKEKYLNHLEKYKEIILEAINKLKVIADGKKLIFICFEKVKKGNECHRILFAEWYKKQTEEEYNELDMINQKNDINNQTENKKPVYEQLSLF